MSNNELNFAIAIKLFGWRWRVGSWLTDKSMACLVSPRLQRTSRQEGFSLIDLPEDGTKLVAWHLPPYADSWEGARLVIEAIKARGYETALSIATDGRIRCLLEIDGRPDVWHEAFGDTLPEAICRAALSTLDTEGSGRDDTCDNI